jgi:hypothetical protein
LGATIAATIGQADLYNTMCHIHTPLIYSLLRSFHALWIGALIGIAAIWVFDEWLKSFVSGSSGDFEEDDEPVRFRSAELPDGA